ncbi:adenosylcobinamide-phosphate synthase [Tumebacillus sp. BK434]|uniref:adenosylcobinamide-phosphate synthase CbiB n=1 Tax=Tumebacillus sp. BK434 TaxID=2512169 RepID=UPI001052FE74|nr:adenosylcobinamide-phosphate synthase CbiB [Tumebacillus sp. BK434]TCP55782.1 adenosylcobinamide-phosphate synthase [Tumebacillus sp. BK434]
MTLAFAYLIDLLVGDPPRLPHPVVWMGKGISALDRLLAKRRRSKWAERLKGILFPLLLVGGVYALSYWLLKELYALHPWLGLALEIWLISTTIAVKGLADAGRGVYKALQGGDLALARQRLSWIVGRDTGHLDSSEIARGGIETVAENIVDAVTAPLFFALLGGAPLALAYRAVNTLDSMVGYKNDKYLHLGWASARLDDLANFIPARLTVPFLVLAAGKKGRDAWRLARRDAKKHPSPNSGWAEAAVAGALGIRLGGENQYHGVKSFRAYLGDPVEPIAPGHILQTISLLYRSTALYLAFLLLMNWLIF